MDNNSNLAETRGFEIDIKKIYHKMKPRLILVVIATILTAVLSGVITHFFFTPQYTATTKLYVYSNSDRVTTNSSITSGELTASQDLVNTYIYILESDTVLEAVIKDLGLDATAGQLRGMINAKKAQDTVAFEVSVTSPSAKWSADVANSLAKIAPDEIVRVVKAGGVEIIDKAKTPKSPSSPNMQKNVMVGMIIGFVASFGLLLIYCLFDTSITSAKDIEREFEIPVLGTIPRLEKNNKSYKSYYGSKDDKSKDKDKDKDKDIDPPNPSVGQKPSKDLIENIKAMKGDEK